MNSANERISGSENGFGPAYNSEHGFFDEPTSREFSMKLIRHARSWLEKIHLPA